MPLQKLSQIEEKLQKEHINIKARYVKLKRCKYALLILKRNNIITINWFKFFKSTNYNCIVYCPNIRWNYVNN